MEDTTSSKNSLKDVIQREASPGPCGKRPAALSNPTHPAKDLTPKRLCSKVAPRVSSVQEGFKGFQVFPDCPRPQRKLTASPCPGSERHQPGAPGDFGARLPPISATQRPWFRLDRVAHLQLRDRSPGGRPLRRTSSSRAGRGVLGPRGKGARPPSATSRVPHRCSPFPGQWGAGFGRRLRRSRLQPAEWSGLPRKKPLGAGEGRAPEVSPQRAPALQSEAHCSRGHCPWAARGTRGERKKERRGGWAAWGRIGSAGTLPGPRPLPRTAQ